ncbi:methyl-accepting chemotaxis protein [Agarivorans sp. Toyoura001]|uniref:methyl-accepting chemotaxis protein n=1 Tax=unclassified Agarivorans TaxID=2636026 RepID=UPI0010E5D269|nr:methyl-accepting chemotaxis protein [Agarivorans sp. Toyoura001]GDY27067.1 chemotaxis protein [Agarivorans sp. Toyoura001]
MKIRTKFLLLLLAGVVFPVLVISIITVWNVRSNAELSFEQRSTAELGHIDTTFSIYLNGLAEDAKFLANSYTIRQLDHSITTYMGKASKPMTPDKNGGVEQTAFHFMREFGEARPDLAYVYLAMDHGGYIQWPLGKNSADYDPRIRPWYPLSIDSTTPVRIPAYQDLVSKTPLVDYMVRFEGQNGAFGTIGVDVTLNKLTDLIKKIKFGEQGYIIMIEDSNTILADPSSEDNLFQDISDVTSYQAIKDSPPGLHTIEKDGETWLANVYLSPDLNWRFIGFMPASEVYQQANSLITLIMGVAILMVVVFIALGFTLMNVITKPMITITEGLEGIASGEGDLTQRLNIHSNDESGQMADAFNRFVESINSLVASIKGNSEQVDNSAAHASELSSTMKQIAEGQLAAVEQVSTAFHEMVATSNEVASNCSQAATSADDSQQQVEEGHQLIQDTVLAVGQLETTLNESNQAMDELSQESANITVILDTIRGIAEQTNLLALNAAIEAARAGEQGRGFAVVADEVRTLAGRTAESTEEIDKLLSNLRQQTANVASKLSSSIEHSSTSVTATNQTSTVFEAILQSVLTIRDMATQIAASAEEQHLVAEEINRNITDIHDGSSQANQVSQELEDSATTLNSLAGSLQEMVSRFKTS